jgi:hypothetical protein
MINGRPAMKRIYGSQARIYSACDYSLRITYSLTFPRANRAPSKNSMTPMYEGPNEHLPVYAIPELLMDEPRNMKNMPKATRAIPISIQAVRAETFS